MVAANVAAMPLETAAEATGANNLVSSEPETMEAEDSTAPDFRLTVTTELDAKNYNNRPNAFLVDGGGV